MSILRTPNRLDSTSEDSTPHTQTCHGSACTTASTEMFLTCSSFQIKFWRPISDQSETVHTYNQEDASAGFVQQSQPCDRNLPSQEGRVRTLRKTNTRTSFLVCSCSHLGDILLTRETVAHHLGQGSVRAQSTFSGRNAKYVVPLPFERYPSKNSRVLCLPGLHCKQILAVTMFQHRIVGS